MKRRIWVVVFFCCFFVTVSLQAQIDEKREPQSSVTQDKDKPNWSKDLQQRTDFTYERGSWTFVCTVTNQSSSVAYQNLKYKVAWFGAATEEEGTVRDVIMPGKKVEFSVSKSGPSPFGKVKGKISGGMILGSKEKDSMVGMGIDEDQIDESIRTKIKIVSAEPKAASNPPETVKKD